MCRKSSHPPHSGRTCAPGRPSGPTAGPGTRAAPPPAPSSGALRTRSAAGLGRVPQPEGCAWMWLCSLWTRGRLISRPVGSASIAQTCLPGPGPHLLTSVTPRQAGPPHPPAAGERPGEPPCRWALQLPPRTDPQSGPDSGKPRRRRLLAPPNEALGAALVAEAPPPAPPHGKPCCAPLWAWGPQPASRGPRGIDVQHGGAHPSGHPGPQAEGQGASPGAGPLGLLGVRLRGARMGPWGASGGASPSLPGPRQVARGWRFLRPRPAASRGPMRPPVRPASSWPGRLLGSAALAAFSAVGCQAPAADLDFKHRGSSGPWRPAASAPPCPQRHPVPSVPPLADYIWHIVLQSWGTKVGTSSHVSVPCLSSCGPQERTRPGDPSRPHALR